VVEDCDSCNNTGTINQNNDELNKENKQ
jgi:hypothetical protein